MPAAFILSVPAIIILYILKPKGTDRKVPSTLLWERLFRNNRSKTVFEKFAQEILMYLEILAAVLIVLALMSPFIMTGRTGGSYVLVIDNSLSMQHSIEAGKTATRLDKAKSDAKAMADSVSGPVTVISCGDRPEILILRSTDKKALKNAISSIEPVDSEGDISDVLGAAEGVEADKMIVYTDAQGASFAEPLRDAMDTDIYPEGAAALNAGIDYISAGEDSVAVKVTNYSGQSLSTDILIYDGDGNLAAVRHISAEPERSTSLLITDLTLKGEYISAELGSISFGGNEGLDSLAADNKAYAALAAPGEINGILISSGNTFIEKAYKAVTGEDILKTENTSLITAGPGAFAIFDAGRGSGDEDISAMYFGTSSGGEVLTNVLINVPSGPLTEGLSEFTIGAAKAEVLDVPDGAKPIMMAGDKCVGYLDSTGGPGRIYLGFDLRDTDFAVSPEFPVFMAESIYYMANAGLLQENAYHAGDEPELRASTLTGDDADIYIEEAVSGERITGNAGYGAPRLNKAGIYRVVSGESSEYFSVLPASEGRDGRDISEDIVAGISGGNERAVRSLRNILIIISILIIILEFIIFVRKMNYRHAFYFITRCVLVLILILALIDVRVPVISGRISTVFVVDMSASNEKNASEMETFLSEQLRDLPKRSRYGIVVFGRDAAIDQFMVDENMFIGLNAKVDRSATDYEDAIKRAVSMMPEGTNKRIVILTDGKETRGDISSTASMIVSDDITLTAVMYESTVGNDAYISDVEMPAVLHAGDSYYMTVSIASNYETPAKLTIYQGGEAIMTEDVRLTKGESRLIFEETARSGGVESYTAVIEAEGDTVPENNEYSAYAQIDESPRILVISGQNESDAAFRELLKAANVNAEYISGDDAPDTLNDMLKYKAFILENIYIDELPEGFLNNLETYVKDYGGGLVMTGGQDSFMPGGYNETPVETVLPVNMELRNTVEIPSVALVCVIDHSGSMTSGGGGGKSYLDLAVEASKRAADGMRDEDYFGAVEFDDTADWVVPLSQADDKSDIKSKLSTIRDGGGTAISPGLTLAEKALISSDADVKHIILLTDGYGESDNFDPQLSSIRSNGITLSTVAVGDGSDTALMEHMAKMCGGRYYYADEGTDIPRIFAQEVTLAGEDYIKNEETALSVSSSNEVTKDLFAEGWPVINGYVAASQKTGAISAISAENGDPILTVWQYGLGKTVSWNTDVSNQWTSGFAGENDYAELWRRIADYAAGGASIGKDSVDIKTENGRTEVIYTAAEYTDDTEIKAVFTDPDGETHEMALSASGPGVYSGEAVTEMSGLYNIRVSRNDGEELTGLITMAAAVQYSDEYRFDVTTDRFEEFINRYGSFAEGGSIWDAVSKNVRGTKGIGDILLAIAVILFVLDIAGRRFGFDPVLRKKGVIRVRGRSKAAAEEYGNAGAYGSATTEGSGNPGAANTSSGAVSVPETGGAPSEESAPADGTSPGGRKKHSGRKKKKEAEMLDTKALLQNKHNRGL